MKRFWWITWGAMMAGFVALDALELAGVGNHVTILVSSLIKYTSIVSCMAFVLIYHRNNSLLVIAMSLTLLADTLLFWTRQVEWGVIVFCFAQIFHTFRLVRVGTGFLFGYSVAMMAVFAWFVHNGTPVVYAVAIIYASGLLLNIFLSWRWKFLTFFGFLLFLGCDSNVGLSFLAGQGVLPAGMAAVTSFLVFIFYFPSQVFLINGRDYSGAKDRLFRRKSQNRRLPNAA